MVRNQLTRQQQRLVRELDEIVARLRMNYREIAEYEPAERTPRLRLVRDHLVRGEIVLAYTLIDEFLNALLVDHFFGGRLITKSSGKLSVSRTLIISFWKS